MNREDIMRIAREADREWDTDYADRIMFEFLDEFAELVAAAEREAIKQKAEAELSNTAMLASLPPKSSAVWNILQAIRARGNND